MTSNINSGIAFTGNPIYVSDTRGLFEGIRGVSFIVQLGDKGFAGRFSADFNINAARILDSMVFPIDEPTESMTWVGPVVTLEDDMSRRTAYITVRSNMGLTDTWQCIVVPGGVSASELRACGGDVFASRFCNYGGNFFLSGRSGDWIIPMGEREISPLYFYKSSAMTSLAVVDPVSGASITVIMPYEGIYALDVAKARRMIFEQHGALASVLDVHTNGQSELSCRIVIEKATRSDSCRVMFRSSLGVMEALDLGEVATVGHELGEDKDYKVYDRMIDDFVNARDRVAVSSTLEVKARPCHPDRAKRILDMVTSDLVYVITDDGRRVRVVPSMGESTYPVKGESVAIPVRFKLADADCRLLPEVGSLTRPRIHVDEFDVEFN